MSQTIWMRCAGVSEARPLKLDVVRVVESQWKNATRKLVDSDEEQALLEGLIDRVKPPAPEGRPFEGLHYLLSTPFRHPPLRNGSRFGRRTERGIFYGSRAIETALAEVAYYRLVFLEGTSADLGLVEIDLTSFEVGARTTRGIDLTRVPFAAHDDVLTSRTAYETTQQLGEEMRAAGIEAFVFRSARDPLGGENIGLLEPCFASKKPRRLEGWTCLATKTRVELRKANVLAERRLSFERSAFEVEGKLPVPAI